MKLKFTCFLHKLKQNYHLLILTFALIMIIAVMITSHSLSYNPIDTEHNSIFKDVWQCSINYAPYDDIILPTNIKLNHNSQIILKNRLPQYIVKGATILLRTSQQDAVVYLNGKIIYSTYCLDDYIPKPSAAYHFIRVPTDSANKEITIKLTSPYDNYSGYINQIYIGSKASNIFFLFKESGFRLAIGLILIISGLIFMFTFIFIKEWKYKAEIICLGAFIACAGYWVVVESKLAQFFIPNTSLLTNTSIVTLSLLPVLSSLYYYNSYTKIMKKSGKFVISIVSAAYILLSITTCLNPRLTLTLLPFCLGFMGVYTLFIFILIVVEYVKYKKLLSIAAVGMSIFAASIILELILFFSNISGYHQSNLFTVGLTIFCICTAADTIKHFTVVYQESVKIPSLSVLAYTDSLTKLKNRTAFFETISTINSDSDGMVSLAMFDVNNLKSVNDSLGHLIGDALIWHCANVLKNSLLPYGEIFRIGGDEFAAIIHHSNNFKIDCFEDRILDLISKENKIQLGYNISFAYGFATYSKDSDNSLLVTLARADKNMYECKKLQKDQ